MRRRLGLGVAAILVAVAVAHLPAAAQTDVPSFAELEAAGAVIGEIRIDTHNIFDLGDPHESGIGYRAANARLHPFHPSVRSRSAGCCGQA